MQLVVFFVFIGYNYYGEKNKKLTGEVKMVKCNKTFYVRNKKNIELSFSGIKGKELSD